MRILPAIGDNLHTPPLQELLDTYPHATLRILRLSHGWYAVDHCTGQVEADFVWLSDQPFDFPPHMYTHLPVVVNTEQRFWRHTDVGGKVGRWVVMAGALQRMFRVGA